MFFISLVNPITKYKNFARFPNGSGNENLSHIRSVLIGIEYRNCRQTLDGYLLFAIWMGQIQSKLINMFVTY